MLELLVLVSCALPAAGSNPVAAGPQPAAAADGRGSASAPEANRSYARRRIRVVPVVEARVPMPRPYHTSGGSIPFANEPRPTPLGAMPGYSVSFTTEWRAIQGDGRVLDELELARVISDPDLVLACEGYRRRVRGLRWGLMVSAPLLAGGGGWLWLEHRHDRDARTVAYSLVGLGVASAVMAFFADTLAHRPIQTLEQARMRTEAYNAKLRSDLGIVPPGAARSGHP